MCLFETKGMEDQAGQKHSASISVSHVISSARFLLFVLSYSELFVIVFIIFYYCS